jgi:hypothetical protein
MKKEDKKRLERLNELEKNGASQKINSNAKSTGRKVDTSSLKW